MSDLTDESVKALLDEMTFAMFGDGTDDTISEKLARALLTARAELDTTQTQVGDWIVRADEANVKVEKLEAELARVRADAAVAVALMVERAAEQADPWDGPVTKNKIVDAQAIVAQQVKARIRALAPDAGTAELAKLRERAEKAEQERVAEWNRRRDADGSRDAARAACDTMRAELAAAQQRERVLREALEACVASLERVDTAEGVCCCGDSMDRHSDPMSCGHSPVDMGDYYAGQALESARAALAQTPTDPGDGWTWNERLGWIGPDGKPADPRRRG